MKRLTLVLLSCALLSGSVLAAPAVPAPATAESAPQSLTPAQALRSLESLNFFNSSNCLLDDEETFEEIAARFRQQVSAWEKNPDASGDYPWVAELLHMALLNDAAFLVRPDILQSFISASSDINAADSYGLTAADYGVRTSTALFYDTLRQAGAKLDIHRGDEADMTALFHAVQQGDIHRMEEFLKLGSYVNAQNDIGETVLAVALQCGNEEVVNALLKHGAKITPALEDDNGYTLLHHAAMGGCADFALQLLREQANPNATSTEEKWTPLMLALIHKHANVAEILLKHGAKISLRDHEGNHAFRHAVDSGDFDCVRLMLREEKKQKTLRNKATEHLPIALSNGDGDIACLLLENGATFDAELEGWNYLCDALRCRNEHLLHLLEKAGAQYEANTPDDNGETQLMLAAEAGFPEITRRLLEDGAAEEAICSKGESVMTYALKGGNPDVIQLLREAGARPDIYSVTEDGDTQIILAARHGLLPELRELLRMGASARAFSRCGKTPLMEALEQGHETIVKELINAGADLSPNHAPGKQTLLMSAAQGGLLTYVRELLKRGHQPNDVHFPTEGDLPPDGTTALMLAAQNGHEDVVRLLLDSGALPHLRNEDGQTASDLARENGHTALANFLLSLP